MTQVVVLSPDELRSLVRAAVDEGVAHALRCAAKSAPNVMNENQAGEYLAVAPATLRRWRIEKRGPAYYKAGTAVRYNRPDLDEWLDANRVHTIDSLEGHHEKCGL